MSFSIVIPVYNVAPYLRDCLDSVLAQTVGDWECICVDDGSTDGSGVLLDEYAARDRRFKVLHRKNAGVASARNAALSVASGEWVAFLDSDDRWQTCLLESCLRAVLRYRNADIVGFGFGELTGESSRVPLSNAFTEYEGDGVFSAATSFFWSRIYRRKLLQGIVFEDYTVGEDILFATKALVRAFCVAVTDAPLYEYRHRPGSAIRSALSERKVADRVGYLAEVLDSLLSCGRQVPASLLRIYANGFTEVLAIEYFKLDRAARQRIRILWRERVRKMVRLGGFQGMRIRMLLNFPFDFCLFVLGWMPCALKQRGLHR